MPFPNPSLTASAGQAARSPKAVFMLCLVLSFLSLCCRWHRNLSRQDMKRAWIPVLPYDSRKDDDLISEWFSRKNTCFCLWLGEKVEGLSVLVPKNVLMEDERRKGFIFQAKRTKAMDFSLLVFPTTSHLQMWHLMYTFFPQGKQPSPAHSHRQVCWCRSWWGCAQRSQHPALICL